MTTETLNPAETETRPSPDAMRGVIPYVSLGGRAGEAADFYARAFGARDLGRMPMEDRPGAYMHIQVEVNGGALMMTDMHDPAQAAPVTPQGFHLQLIVGDGQAWWRRAVEAGCTVRAPYERQFWGDEWGLLEDPFGLLWAVLEPAPET
jgi:PhnB protein